MCQFQETFDFSKEKWVEYLTKNSETNINTLQEIIRQDSLLYFVELKKGS